MAQRKKTINFDISETYNRKFVNSGIELFVNVFDDAYRMEETYLKLELVVERFPHFEFDRGIKLRHADTKKCLLCRNCRSRRWSCILKKNIKLILYDHCEWNIAICFFWGKWGKSKWLHFVRIYVKFEKRSTVSTEKNF